MMIIGPFASFSAFDDWTSRVYVTGTNWNSSAARGFHARGSPAALPPLDANRNSSPDQVKPLLPLEDPLPRAGSVQPNLLFLRHPDALPLPFRDG